MILIQGTLINAFLKPESVNKTTGEVYPAKNVIQLQHEVRTKDGQRKFELVDLSFEGKLDPFQPYLNKEVYLNVNPYTIKDSFKVGYTLIGLHGKATAN